MKRGAQKNYALFKEMHLKSLQIFGSQNEALFASPPLFRALPGHAQHGGGTE